MGAQGRLLLGGSGDKTPSSSGAPSSGWFVTRTLLSILALILLPPRLDQHPLGWESVVL